MKELFLFAREFARTSRTTGSMFPTGRLAARALASPLLERSWPVRVLELGPGTGAVTRSILRALQPGDSLDICEINERFLGVLEARLETNADFVAHKEQVRFLCCPAQELPDGPPYDVIVCSLPFLNFDLETVAQILSRLRRRSHGSTRMTHFSYRFATAVGGFFGGAPVRERQRAVQAHLDAHGRAPLSHVWWNLPPLTVYAMEPGPRLEPGTPSAPELAAQAA